MRKLFNDEAGLVVSAELVLVLTIGVLAMVVGLTAVRDAVNSELDDLSDAFGAISQSYNVNGAGKASSGTKGHANIAGFAYNDTQDNCDCREIALAEVCGKTDSGSGTAE